MTATVEDLAAVALGKLAREGKREDGPTWRAAWDAPTGLAFDVSCAGPDLPGAIETRFATPEEIFKNRPWHGTYRLVVRAARLIVLDLYWNPGEPTRIMGFSRGDWERQLLAAA